VPGKNSLLVSSSLQQHSQQSTQFKKANELYENLNQEISTAMMSFIFGSDEKKVLLFWLENHR
jgi:hypothetical protein